jgi:DNA polymerase-3 subunit delta
MILFLYGKDTFRLRQKLKEIINRYKTIHKSGLNLKFFDGESLNFQNFEREAQLAPMMAEKKLIVIEGAIGNKDFERNFLANAKRFLNSDIVFLFCEPREIKENTPLFDFLKKFSKKQEFNLLTKQKVKIWLRREFQKYGMKVEEDVLDKLVEFVGNDLWQMENEIKKLIVYKKGKKIKVSDIETLIKPKIEIDVFKAIDAISSKNKKLAFTLLHKLLKRGEKPTVLFATIKYQFRNLLQVKDLIERGEKISQIKNKMELHPFVLEKILRISQKFKIEELRKIYQRIFNLDLAIKTGKIEPDLALDLLLADL